MTRIHDRRTMRSAMATLLLIVAACGGPSSGTASPTGDATDTGGRVTTYRGDDARTGTMPGPGPSGTPSVAWQFTAGGPFANSPVVADGNVYAVSGDGVAHALRLTTGVVAWEHDVMADIDASPVIVDDLLIVADESGGVTALAIADGRQAWTTRLDGVISGSPAVVQGDLVVATQDGLVYRLDAAAGATVWTADVGDPVSRSVAADVGVAYVGAGGDLIALDATDGHERWRTSLATDGSVSTPTIVGGRVYAAAGLDSDHADDRALHVVDAATGAVEWRYASPDALGLYSPAVVGDRAFIIGHDRRVVALDAATGTLGWQVEMETELEALPVVVGNVLYVIGNGGPVSAMDATTGAPLWEVPIDGIPFGPTVVDGYLLVGTEIGTLYAITGS